MTAGSGASRHATGGRPKVAELATPPSVVTGASGRGSTGRGGTTWPALASRSGRSRGPGSAGTTDPADGSSLVAAGAVVVVVGGTGTGSAGVVVGGVVVVGPLGSAGDS